ncbi:MAG: hypothetical protein KAJ19_10805, partial [Gammaproteobacteria bacterium]|nr:hypothetical protein [Gammaproteobacteria bacterium]
HRLPFYLENESYTGCLIPSMQKLGAHKRRKKILQSSIFAFFYGGKSFALSSFKLVEDVNLFIQYYNVQG